MQTRNLGTKVYNLEEAQCKLASLPPRGSSVARSRWDSAPDKCLASIPEQDLVIDVYGMYVCVCVCACMHACMHANI